MTPPLAFLGDFGGGVDFIFHARHSNLGVEVGGHHNWGLLATHLELTGASMGLAMLVALPLGLVLGHTGKGAFLAISTSNVGRAVPSVALLAAFRSPVQRRPPAGAASSGSAGPCRRADRAAACAAPARVPRGDRAVDVLPS